MTLGGEVKEGYASVEVELEDGTVEGWVPREVLNRSARESLPEDSRKDVDEEEDEDVPPKPNRRRSDEPDDDEAVVTRPRSRLRVPKDEGLLLRRESTFFYGIQAQGGLSMLQTDVSTNVLSGISFGGGAHIGYYVSNNIVLRLEAGYLLTNGSDPDGTIIPISIGFLDSALSVSYYIDNFELYAGVGYLFGISISDLPAGLKTSIAGASDLSTAIGEGGAGYRIPISDVTGLVIRARYTFGFIRSPVGVSVIQGMAFLEFRG